MSDSTQKMVIINPKTLEDFMAHIVDQPDMDDHIKRAARELAKSTMGSPRQSFKNSMERVKDFSQESDFSGQMHGFFIGVHAGIGLALCSNDATIAEAVEKFTKQLDGMTRMSKAEVKTKLAEGEEPVKAEVTDEEARAIAKREFAKMRTMGGKQ